MIELFHSVKLTKYYPYETARVVDRILIIDNAKAVSEFHDEISHVANRPPDNKETYEATTEGGSKLYFQFWDCVLYVGFGVVLTRDYYSERVKTL